MANVALSTPKATKEHGHHLSVVVWCHFSQVVSQAAVRIISGFRMTLANALGWRTCFPSSLASLMPSHSVQGWCSGQAPSSVGLSPFISPRDQSNFTLIFSFSSRWFSSRVLGETLRYGNASCSAKCLHRVSTSLLLEELLVRHFSVGRRCLIGWFSNLRIISHLLLSPGWLCNQQQARPQLKHTVTLV